MASYATAIGALPYLDKVLPGEEREVRGIIFSRA